MADVAAMPDGSGYFLARHDGRVANFGAAPSLGGALRQGRDATAADAIVSIAVSSTGAGYWLAGRDGKLYSFGDAAAFPVE